MEWPCNIYVCLQTDDVGLYFMHAWMKGAWRFKRAGYTLASDSITNCAIIHLHRKDIVSIAIPSGTFSIQ